MRNNFKFLFPPLALKALNAIENGSTRENGIISGRSRSADKMKQNIAKKKQRRKRILFLLIMIYDGALDVSVNNGKFI